MGSRCHPLWLSVLVLLIGRLTVEAAQTDDATSAQRKLDPWTRSFRMLKEAHAQQQSLLPIGGAQPASANGDTVENDTTAASAGRTKARKRKKHQHQHQPPLQLHQHRNLVTASAMASSSASSTSTTTHPHQDRPTATSQSNASAAVVFGAVDKQRHTIERQIVRDQDTRLVIHHRIKCTPCKISAQRHRPRGRSSS